MRYFNTTGPIREAQHYCVPLLERIDLDMVLRLIDEQHYFVLHAPRQTGKTSTLFALRDLLNARGDHCCVYANVELAQAARENTEDAMRAIFTELAIQERVTIGSEWVEQSWPSVLAKAGPNGALRALLSRWSEMLKKPLVLFLDEVDALIGDTLLAVLRQLRTGYALRPQNFPQSVILCGVRDVRDYRIHASSEKEIISGGSAFNIKAQALRVGDFSQDDVAALLAQHHEETSQVFTEAAVDAVWEQTQGQPWLVNALGCQACFWSESHRDRSRVIDAEAILDAREALIERHEVHLDQLADKLQEGRVRRVIEPLLTGRAESAFTARDLEYVRDLGLVARDEPLRIANPIYAEVIPREMTYAVQVGIVQDTAWYVKADGGLDLEKLLAAFQSFFREHSEHWIERFEYREAGPQLLLQAFLQRVVNGGGRRIEREYGLGRGRTDLMIIWPHGEVTERFVVECKLLHKGLEATIRDGVHQTIGYLDRCDGDAGHLVIFDREPGKTWEDKIFHRKQVADGREIGIWGM